LHLTGAISKFQVPKVKDRLIVLKPVIQMIYDNRETVTKY